MGRKGVTDFEVFQTNIVRFSEPIGVAVGVILVTSVGNPWMLAAWIVNGPSVFIDIQQVVTDVTGFTGTDVLSGARGTLYQNRQVEIPEAGIDVHTALKQRDIVEVHSYPVIGSDFTVTVMVFVLHVARTQVVGDGGVIQVL